MSFFKKAELPSISPVTPAAPGPLPVPYPTLGSENSVAQDKLAGGPVSLNAPDAAVSGAGGPGSGASDMFSVLMAFGKMTGKEARDDRALRRGKSKAEEAGVRRQIDVAVRNARRAADPGAMIAALDAMRPLGESLAPTEAGKSAWRGAVSDARRLWESVERASGSMSRMAPASRKGGGAGFPDICKAPAPPAPFVPIPYPNLAGLPSVSAPSTDDASQAAGDAAGAVQDVLQEGAEAAGEAAEEAQETGQEVASNAQDTGENAVNTVKGWFGG